MHRSCFRGGAAFRSTSSRIDFLLTGRGGKLVTDQTKRAKSDASLKGIKTMMKVDPERAGRLADEIIRNTYRVLMTRGMKGCYVFCVDAELGEYLRRRVPRAGEYVRAAEAVPLAAEGETRD